MTWVWRRFEGDRVKGLGAVLLVGMSFTHFDLFGLLGKSILGWEEGPSKGAGV